VYRVGRALRGKKLIVLVTGMPGSGKSIVSRVARSMGIPVYVMGDVVREEAMRRGIEPTPANLNMLARRLREEYGPTIVAEKVAEKLRADCKHNIVLVDGVRSLDEVKVFEKLGRTIIIAIHASPRTRFERLRRRGRPGDPKTWEEFRQRDLTELGFGLGGVIALADYMLVNEGSIEEFEERVRRLLDQIVSEAEKDPS
jgi:dephospho-CoA kinase